MSDETLWSSTGIETVHAWAACIEQIGKPATWHQDDFDNALSRLHLTLQRQRAIFFPERVAPSQDAHTADGVPMSVQRGIQLHVSSMGDRLYVPHGVALTFDVRPSGGYQLLPRDGNVDSDAEDQPSASPAATEQPSAAPQRRTLLQSVKGKGDRSSLLEFDHPEWECDELADDFLACAETETSPPAWAAAASKESMMQRLSALTAQPKAEAHPVASAKPGVTTVEHEKYVANQNPPADNDKQTPRRRSTAQNNESTRRAALWIHPFSINAVTEDSRMAVRFYSAVAIAVDDAPPYGGCATPFATPRPEGSGPWTPLQDASRLELLTPPQESGGSSFASPGFVARRPADKIRPRQATPQAKVIDGDKQDINGKQRALKADPKQPRQKDALHSPTESAPPKQLAAPVAKTNASPQRSQVKPLQRQGHLPSSRSRMPRGACAAPSVPAGGDTRTVELPISPEKEELAPAKNEGTAPCEENTAGTTAIGDTKPRKPTLVRPSPASANQLPDENVSHQQDSARCPTYSPSCIARRLSLLREQERNARANDMNHVAPLRDIFDRAVGIGWQFSEDESSRRAADHQSVVETPLNIAEISQCLAFSGPYFPPFLPRPVASRSGERLDKLQLPHAAHHVSRSGGGGGPSRPLPMTMAQQVSNARRTPHQAAVHGGVLGSTSSISLSASAKPGKRPFQDDSHRWFAEHGRPTATAAPGRLSPLLRQAATPGDAPRVASPRPDDTVAMQRSLLKALRLRVWHSLHSVDHL